MKLSIIIPCFNEEKYIEEVIDSINSQKIEDKEIIVVNDASTDGTKEKLTKLKNDKKIKKVIICSGKIYFDLLEAREKIKNDEVYLIRIEQLYPLLAVVLS